MTPAELDAVGDEDFAAMVRVMTAKAEDNRPDLLARFASRR
jgi:hypothetical protein